MVIVEQRNNINFLLILGNARLRYKYIPASKLLPLVPAILEESILSRIAFCATTSRSLLFSFFRDASSIALSHAMLRQNL
jgi:hypothetical protein